MEKLLSSEEAKVRERDGDDDYDGQKHSREKLDGEK